MGLTDTEFGWHKKILLIQIDNIGAKKRRIIGWEEIQPEKGKPYKVYLQNGKIFTTSPVTTLSETARCIEIRTKNSFYLIEYL